MAHIWYQDPATRVWMLNGIEADSVTLTPAKMPLLRPVVESDYAGAATLQCHHEGSRELWALLVPYGFDAEVNGAAVLAGIHVLADGDALRLIGNGPLFFSTDTLARVQTFPSQQDNVSCPRCTRPLTFGMSAVQCPTCRTWLHQTDNLPCWTNAATCSLCSQPTAFDAGYRWTPAEL